MRHISSTSFAIAFMEASIASNSIKWLIKIPLFLQMKAYWKRTEERSRVLSKEEEKHALARVAPCKYLLVRRVASRKNILRSSSSHVPHPRRIQGSSSILFLLLVSCSSFYRIANREPTWKICLREKRARRSSRPSLFSNFSATDKQHATIYYNNIMRRTMQRHHGRESIVTSPFRVPGFQITMLKRAVMKRPRLLQRPFPSHPRERTANFI